MAKISTFPAVASPDIANDHLIGNASGVTSRYLLGDVLDLNRDLKPFMPRNTYMLPETGPDIALGSVNCANITAYWPFWVSEECTLTEVLANVNNLQVGSLCRVGLYSFTGMSGATALTGSLISDFGTLSGDTTGDKTLSVSQAVSRGMYLIAAAHSNHSTVRWRRLGSSLIGPPLFGESSTQDASISHWEKSGVDYSAGLPASIDVTTARGATGARAGAIIYAKFT